MIDFCVQFNDYLTLAGNNMFWSAAIYLTILMTVIAFRHVRRHGWEWANLPFAGAFIAIQLAIGIRVGWWAIAIAANEVPTDERFCNIYDQWFVANRWLPTIVTGIGYTVASVYVMQFVGRFSRWRTLRDLIVIFGFSFGAAWIWLI